MFLFPLFYVIREFHSSYTEVKPKILTTRPEKLVKSDQIPPTSDG